MLKLIMHRRVATGFVGGCLLMGVGCTPSLVPTRVITLNPPYDQAPAPTPLVTAPGANSTALPAGFVFGPGDQISVVFWREKELSADVVVGPDGNIVLPLINEIRAAGRTPEEVRLDITAAADKFVTDPTVAVVVKEIRSRMVFITGEVAKPGPYALNGPMSVLQMIAIAGGVNEWAKEDQIVVVRTDPSGVVRRYKFNFNEVLRGKNLRQNLELKPGDTIVVP